jgi:hypothetical protein
VLQTAEFFPNNPVSRGMPNFSLDRFNAKLRSDTDYFLGRCQKLTPRGLFLTPGVLTVY